MKVKYKDPKEIDKTRKHTRENNPMSNPLFRKKVSLSKIGKKNPMYGRSPIWHTCEYKGIEFRSSWEVEYAKLFDTLDINWEYESKRFIVGAFTYCPDFYLPDINAYVEVKGYFRNQTKAFYREFKESNPRVRWYMTKGITDAHKDATLSFLELCRNTGGNKQWKNLV